MFIRVFFLGALALMTACRTGRGANAVDTPESAVQRLEAAYRAKDIEAAVAAKDFVTEARLMLQQVGGSRPGAQDFSGNSEILREAASGLELSPCVGGAAGVTPGWVERTLYCARRRLNSRSLFSESIAVHGVVETPSDIAGESSSLMDPLKIFETVKVVRLLEAERRYDGTEHVARPPRLGDTGAIVCVHDLNGEPTSYTVENVAPDGNTIWLADFLREEIDVQPDKLPPLSDKLPACR